MRDSSLKSLYGKKYFDRYRIDAGYRPSLATFLEEVMKHKPKRVLDVGCGHGHLVELLLKAGVDAVGLDFSEYAGERIPKERIIVAEAQELPFPDKSFDVVCSKGVLEHIPEEELDQVYSEMERVGKHVMAEVCVKDTPAYGHITIHPKEWWRERFPRLQLIVRFKGRLI